MKTEILSAPARALTFCATVLVFSVCISRAPVWAQENLAQRYENTAKEMLVKVEEQKKRLQHYDDKSYLYGREGQDFQSHALALLRKYERAAEEATTQAFHHGRALELAKRDNDTTAETPRQLSSG
ncbi:MAG: hypothetical protein ABJA60_12610 [Nitrosospira sp.]